MHRPKKRLAPSPRPASDGPTREVRSERSASAPIYPTARELLDAADLRTILANALRAAAASGLVLVGVTASGCADPVCAASSLGEAKAHGESAARDLASLELGASYDELRIGLGITPHPMTPMMAGEMVPVMPMVVPASTGGTPGGEPEG